MSRLGLCAPRRMQLTNRHWVSGDRYRFGFNGKEADDEWNGEGNMYNYGFRIHDPRLGRFLSVDPLAPDYPWYTPYQYAGNTPIQAVDLDGLEPWLVVPLGEAVLAGGIASLVAYAGYKLAGGIKLELRSGARSLPELASPGGGYIPCIPSMAYVPTVYVPDQTVHATSISSQKAEKLVDAYSKVHSSAETKSQATQKKQEEKGNFVYRVIRTDENQMVGLTAKNPSANYTIEEQILDGNHIDTQYISTTKDPDIAFLWHRKSWIKNWGLVKIDLDKVIGAVYDLNDQATCNYFLRTQGAKNLATASKEVIIEGYVPPNAITRVKGPN